MPAEENWEEADQDGVDRMFREINEEWENDEEIILDEYCPKCGREYDEIDYEYQICHWCKYDNNKTKASNSN